MNIKTILNGINLAVSVGGAVITAGEVMYKTFQWYEKKYGKKKDTNVVVRPVIKGGKKKIINLNNR